MREATRLELAIVRLQPQGTRINVTLPACTFQALMTWLDALARQGIRLSLAVSAQPTQPGWVTVTTLVLERRMPRVAFGLLDRGAHLFWLLLTAPARLLTSPCRTASGSVSSPEPYGKVRPD